MGDIGLVLLPRMVAFENDPELSEAYDGSLVRYPRRNRIGLPQSGCLSLAWLNDERFSDLVSEGIRNLRELRETQTKSVGEREVLPSRIAPFGRRLSSRPTSHRSTALTDYIVVSPTFAAMNAHGAFATNPLSRRLSPTGGDWGSPWRLLERGGERIALAVA